MWFLTILDKKFSEKIMAHGGLYQGPRKSPEGPTGPCKGPLGKKKKIEIGGIFCQFFVLFFLGT